MPTCASCIEFISVLFVPDFTYNVSPLVKVAVLIAEQLNKDS
jgi:hypothetical protein